MEPRNQDEFNLALTMRVPTNNCVWLGGTDSTHEGTWTWDSDSTPVPAQFWAPNNPNFNGDHGDYVCIFKDGFRDGFLREIFPFICTLG